MDTDQRRNGIADEYHVVGELTWQALSDIVNQFLRDNELPSDTPINYIELSSEIFGQTVVVSMTHAGLSVS